MPERDTIVVIGGGAAGIVAAWKAGSLGARLMLLERNKKLGVKLLISGGGKCNITHAGPMESLRNAFVPHEARFLKPSFYRFSNDDVVRMIEERGVQTYTRPNGRIFPVSGNADDVVEALASYLRVSGVEVRVNTRVVRINASGGQVSGVETEGRTVPSSHIILASGGASYRKTGTTGDGYGWARDLGHQVVPVRPALAPIGVSPPLPQDWRGVALRGGTLMLFSRGRKLFEQNDDILFSHEGITGPAALEASRLAALAMEEAEVELRFDFFPSKEFDMLDGDLNDRILSKRDRMIVTVLEEMLPDRIVPFLLKSIDIDPAKRCHVVRREERRRITGLLKSWPMGKASAINLDRGEVSAGGIALGEVDPQTMRSRKVRGLYICGEVLDVAGPVGGYNLQAAFSTGFVAGETAAQDWLSSQDRSVAPMAAGENRK